MEIFKVIEEANNYEISNFGNVRKIGEKEYKSFSIMSKGYKQVCLNGKSYLIHRLVAQAFCEKINPSYNIVNHKDENKLNNKADNLEWCDNKYNLAYSDCFNRNSISNSHGSIIEYDKNGNKIKEYNSLEYVYKNVNKGAAIKNAINRNTFNRFFNGSFWFKESEEFDVNRYKPTIHIKVISKVTKKEFIGTVGEVAKFISKPVHYINNKKKKYDKFEDCLYNYIIIKE